MKLFIFGLLIGFAFTVLLSARVVRVNEVDETTKTLCMQYALRDHEKEIAPERWKVFGEDFKKFDWYSSCINHVKYPVAERKL